MASDFAAGLALALAAGMKVTPIIFVVYFALKRRWWPVAATLAAARSLGRSRIVVVFQPHLYSRTRDFASGFGAALAAADLIVVTDVYASREAPIQGVSGNLIAEAARTAGTQDVTYVPDRGAVAGELLGRVRPGDLVIVMGAGDIRSAGEELLRRL